MERLKMDHGHQKKLKKLAEIIKELDGNTPRELPMQLFGDLLLIQSCILRESIFLRIKELAKSAYDDCLNDRLIAAILIARGVMETEALFAKFVSEIECGIKDNDFDGLKVFLLDVLQGARSEIATKQFKRRKSIHIHECIKYMDKKVPGYRHQYEFLSEFAHPNSAGLNKIYSRLDQKSQRLFFENKRDKIDIDFVIKQMVISLEHFIYIYDKSAEYLEQWMALSTTINNKLL
jgi:hypothetical protein